MPISKVMRAALRAISRHDPDLQQNYQRTRKLFDAAHPPLANPYTIWDRHLEREGHPIPVRIFLPETGLPDHVIVFFHGGGWVTGGIDSYTTVCARTANLCQSIVVSVDYQLAPEHPFPAGLEDCYAVAKEVFFDCKSFGLDSDHVVLMGDSAGGNLTAAVSLLARDRSAFFPRKQILIYPATYNNHGENSPYASVRENGTDYLLTSKKVRDYMTLYAGDNPESWQSPYFAPLLANDLSIQPSTLILSAEFCPLRDEGEAYGERLYQAGNLVRVHRIHNALHGYFSLPTAFAPVRRSYQLINNFLKED